jgi:hypothetical protein
VQSPVKGLEVHSILKFAEASGSSSFHCVIFSQRQSAISPFQMPKPAYHRLVTIPSVRWQAFDRRTGGTEFEFGIWASHVTIQ